MRKKVRSGKKTIVFQVKVALDSIDYVGQSKRFPHPRYESHPLVQAKEKTSSDYQNFVKWVK